MVRFKTTPWTITVLATLCLAGCSNSDVERVAVSGKVLIDGEPLTQGIIRIEPQGARMAASKIDSEGRFSLMTYEPGDGAPLGAHPVTINAAERLGANAVKWHAPPKYAIATQSGIQLEVTEPTDEVVIELTWDGKEPFIQRVGPDSE